MLECYYCTENYQEACNALNFGEKVMCQKEAPDGLHYGDSCFVGHTGRLN